MAPGALGGLSQVMPSLPQDTYQDRQPADPTLPEQSRMYTGPLPPGISLSRGRPPAPYSLLIGTQRYPKANAQQLQLSGSENCDL